MASAAITIVDAPATIESDITERVITKDASMPLIEGTLVNHGPTDVWMKISVSPTAAATVVTTGAQAQLQCPLAVGDEFCWLPHYQSVAHVTKAGASTLSWRPIRRID